MDAILIREGEMERGIATQGGTAAGTLPAPAPRCYSETVYLTELACEGRTFLFSHPLPVQIVQEHGGCSFESEEYGLMAYGDTRSEAESSFRHVFLYIWDRIASENDEKLTRDAIDLKQNLLALAKATKYGSSTF
jgi:hypothetical protein